MAAKINAVGIPMWLVPMIMAISGFELLADDHLYEYSTSGGEVEIVRYKGSETTVILPAEIDGYPVSKIGSGAFYGNTGITSVTFHDKITRIEYEAFANTGLRQVVIPDQVTHLGHNAFRECASLTNVVIGRGVTNDMWSVFEDCPRLKSAELYVNPRDAFRNVLSLQQVTLHDGVKQIDNQAFSGLTNLSSVSIAGSVTNIDYNAFYGCLKLSNAVLPPGLQTLGSGSFSKTGLRQLIIPDTVTAVHGEAFAFCQALTNVVIGAGMKEGWGWNAFEGCVNLRRAVCRSVPDGLFRDLPGLREVVIESTVTKIGYEAFSGCSNLVDVTISDGVVSIEQRAFAGSGIRNLVIPDSVQRFENESFRDCLDLTNVVIGAGTQYDWNWSPFEGCVNLRRAVCRSVPPRILRDLPGLHEVVIESTVTNIGYGAFSACTNLAEIKIPMSVVRIGGDAFANTGIRNLVVPDSVKLIEGEAFSRCQSLTNAVIGRGLESYGGWGIFSGCENLKTITAFSLSGDGMLSAIPGLESVILMDGVSNIYDDTFEECENLKSIAIPGSVTNIGDNAFDDCFSLQSVTIPDSVVAIGDAAFENCYNLTTLNLGSGLTSIGIIAFRNCRSLEEVVMPEGLVSVGIGAFEGCINIKSIALPGPLKVTATAMGLGGAVAEQLLVEALTEDIAGTISTTSGSFGLATREELSNLVDQRFSEAITSYRLPLKTHLSVGQSVTITPASPIHHITLTNPREVQLTWNLADLDLDEHVYTWEAWITLASADTTLILPQATNTPALRVLYLSGDARWSASSDGETLQTVWRAFKSGEQINLVCNPWLQMEAAP